MPRVYTVQKARKADPRFGIEVGDKYFWWEFRYGGVRKSKVYPKRSQLTQSNFLAQVYDLEDEMSRVEAQDGSDLQSQIDDFISTMEGIRDECQEAVDNMPEQLQDGSIAQQRVEALDEAINELEAICTDDGPDDEEDAEATENWLQGKIEEVTCVSINY